MIACLRSTRFSYPDRSAMVFVDLRRLHNISALGERNAKQFVVTKRLFNPTLTINKHFGTKAEARRYWYEEAGKLSDMGMIKEDLQITGFHEES